MSWRTFHKSVASRFIYMYSFDALMNSLDLRSCGLIFPKTVLTFPKNFLNFRSHMIEKRSIINLNSYSHKSYTSVVVSDSVVAFLLEGEDTAFCSFLYCVVFLHGNSIIKGACHQISPSPMLQELFQQDLQLFCFFIFFLYHIEFFICKLSKFDQPSWPGL